MKYNNRLLSDLSLKELQAANWEMAGKEDAFNESLKHSKFEKLKPKPQLGEAFRKLRQEIKDEISKREMVTN